jgi:cytochrome c oxidase subunit 2
LRRQTPQAVFALGLLLAAAAAGGCQDAPSPLDPITPQATRIADLGWFLIAAATAVCVVVFAALAAALTAARRRPAGASDQPSPAPDRLSDNPSDNRIVVIAGMVIPAVVIVVTLGYTIHVLREVAGRAGAASPHAAHAEGGARGGASAPGAPLASDGAPLAVEITGRQWWWEIAYPAEGVVTANEVHVPAGTPVRFSVTAADVIHSFWVPQAGGKVDAVPGRVNVVTFRVDQPGVYRGMCAEFCGLQHAHMHLRLIVDSPADFASWLAAQQRVPPAPAESLVAQGQRIFLGASGATCAQCHTVRGTSAAGTRGPDLTHVAGRRTLGAGTHETTRDSLTGWTATPQEMKPGNKMPPTELSDAEVRAVVAYLESLE